MIEAIVEACAAADATVATDSIVVKVSESSFSQVGAVQFGQSFGQPKYLLKKSLINNLVYSRKY